MAWELRSAPAIKALEEIVIHPCTIHPTLGVIIAPESDSTASDWSYAKSIIKRGSKYQANVDLREAADISEAYRLVVSMRNDPKYSGIIIVSSFQGGNDQYLKDYIPTPLDLDCSSSQSLGHMLCDKSQTFYRVAPCTAAAIYKLFEYNNVNLSGKRVGVVGRSTRVGRPTAQLLSIADATVTLYHSKSDLSSLKDEDIVISAIGKPKLLTADMFREGQMVVDAGVSTDPKTGKLCGDVDYESVRAILGNDGAITPVPSGIGPLTTTVLFSKLFVNAIRLRGGMDPQEACLC